MDREEAVKRGCLAEGNILLAVVLWGLTGLLIGWVLSSSVTWLQVLMFLLAVIFGSTALTLLLTILLARTPEANLLSYIGSVCLFLAGGALLLYHKAAVTSGPRLLLGLAILLAIVGIALLFIGIRVVRSDPGYWGAWRPPEPKAGRIAAAQPLSFGWRIKGALWSLFDTRLRGALFMPLAWWPWMSWSLPLLGLNISPFGAAIVITLLIYFLAFLPVLVTTAYGHVLRGKARVEEAGKLVLQYKALPDTERERQKANMDHDTDNLNEEAASDFWEALQRRQGGLLSQRGLRIHALCGLAEALLCLDRNTDALTYAQEALQIEANPQTYMWLGTSLYESGRYDEALKAFRQGLDVSKMPQEKEALTSWIEGIEEDIAKQRPKELAG